MHCKSYSWLFMVTGMSVTFAYIMFENVTSHKLMM